MFAKINFSLTQVVIPNLRHLIYKTYSDVIISIIFSVTLLLTAYNRCEQTCRYPGISLLTVINEQFLLILSENVTIGSKKI